MKLSRKNSLFGLIPLLCSTTLLAQSVFTAEEENTVIYSATPVMGTNTDNNSWHLAQATQSADADSLLFPVTSNLTPGVVNPIQKNIHGLVQPLFVMGDDANSIDWAKNHANELTTLHAIGLLTNTQTAARWRDIEHETGLALIPASLDGLQDIIAVNHYPFLLTNHGVEQ